MSDIFISYSRSTEGEATRIAEALRALGYGVWRDDELPAHRAYAEVIEERLRAAKAVLVIWSAEAARSQWVRAEADVARNAGKLVQVSIDGAMPPLPFNQIQCADLTGWAGEPASPAWIKVTASVAELVAGRAAPAAPAASSSATAPAAIPATPRTFSVGVGAIADAAGAAAGDDFADGLAGEIATALARFLVLSVTDAGPGVRYLVDGAVRRAGDQARITLQLRDAGGRRVWAERFDGDLADPFALQDDVAACAACRIEAAILRNETQPLLSCPLESLTAQEAWLRGRESLRRSGLEQVEEIETFAGRAAALDPRHAPALALKACGLGLRIAYAGAGEDTAPMQAQLKETAERALTCGAEDPEVLTWVAEALLLTESDIVAARALVDRALEMNPGLGVAWDIAANVRPQTGEYEEAYARYQRCLRLDPTSPWRTYVWPSMAGCLVVMGRPEEAIALAKEGLQISAGNPWGAACLIAAYGQCGRIEEVRAVLKDFDPRQAGVFRTNALGPKLTAMVKEALEKAGWEGRRSAEAGWGRTGTQGGGQQ